MCFKNIFISVLFLLLGLTSTAGLAGGKTIDMSMKLICGLDTFTAQSTQSKFKKELAKDSSVSCSTSSSYTSCTDGMTFKMDKPPKHGTLSIDTAFGTNPLFTFTNNDSGSGYLGSAREKITIKVSCKGAADEIILEVSTSGTVCGNTETGMVILDNTATPGQETIETNLGFYTGCDKDFSTIKTGFGGNAINIADFHMLRRDMNTNPNSLELVIGSVATDVSEGNFNTDSQLNYFKDGQHLFELNRLRSTADWLASTSDLTHTLSAGTYGTMDMQQFVDNIAAGKTMYGIVRVKIGLQKGTCGSDCIKNALGNTVNPSDVYGFCNITTTTGLCACAPANLETANSFKSLEGGVTICGTAIPTNAKLKVKGALLWDFVDYATGVPIALSQLPFAPRKLYFKVELPIMVNWSYDTDNNGAGDGVMDNMPVVKAISNGKTEGKLTPTINYSDVPAESRALYLSTTGVALNSTAFAKLSKADQYHLLLPSGYVSGWVDAFSQLGMTAAIWKTLPPDSCRESDGSTQCTKFSLPKTASGTLGADDVRSDDFEDIPTYLYSGGLIDMHHHVNISGLVYVPQALELEAKDGYNARQYISGALIVRDGFFIQANDNTVTVISADPSSYSTAKVHTVASVPDLQFDFDGPGSSSSSDTEVVSDADVPSCLGCLPGTTDSGGTPSSGKPGDRIWMEVRAQ